MSIESRARLAVRQTALMETLLHNRKTSEEFDRQRLVVTAQSLIQKRERIVAKIWPSLADALGSSYSELFSQYAFCHDVPAGCALTDAKRFMQDLARNDLLPDSLLIEFFCVQGWQEHRIWCEFIKRIMKWNRVNCLMRSLCPMMHV